MKPYCNPFTQPGRWYRGNLHTHTTASDGALSIAERCAAYRAAGYDFLAITDHHLVHDLSGCSTADFLVLSGSEVHPVNPRTGEFHHLVALDIHQPIDETLPAQAVIDAIHAQGGLAILCHPYWCGLSLLDILPLSGYFAMEVYNDVAMTIGKAFSESSWDEILDNIGAVCAVAVDDAHGSENDCFHGWIMLKAAELSLDAVKTALSTGAFYATTGPHFTDLALEEIAVTAADGAPARARQLTVACSPVQSIVVKGQRYHGWRVVAPDGESLTSASYRIPTEMKYLRVEITDANGKRAWSNPVMLHEGNSSQSQ